ncbi:Bax inhibitor-1/YccA family protein [Occultella glacieicola]|uniref:Bax inhibitor-1/YccA family protein n=1 Tax=Occultella glacieicola TaxID=2518684 RepID=A0ABY2E2U0_9MICO|nr:Bax inhibitor-1/YccA family protein [Occultella glacieicola]TDE93944.1 Bax inhibitor-1/YccA family protein [Occultella glacieicola]
MANPFFTNSAEFGKSKPNQPPVNPYGQAGYPGQPGQHGYGQQPYGATATQGYDPQFAGIEQSYYGPDAGPAQTGRLTYDDVIVKTAGVLAVVIGVAVAAWFAVPVEMRMPVMFIGLIGGFVLGLVNAFKREPSPALIIAYAAFEGAFLGMISGVFETMWPGIVVQAVLATFVTFAVTLALFKSGKVRVTPKFTRFLLIAGASYLVFSLVNLGLMWFGGMDGFGLRSVEIMGIPLGLVIGLFAVVLAAMNLIWDFDSISKGIQNGAPAKMAWSAAFGITITLVWLYLEFLRILAILRGD